MNVWSPVKLVHTGIIHYTYAGLLNALKKNLISIQIPINVKLVKTTNSTARRKKNASQYKAQLQLHQQIKLTKQILQRGANLNNTGMK